MYKKIAMFTILCLLPAWVLPFGKPFKSTKEMEESAKQMQGMRFSDNFESGAEVDPHDELIGRAIDAIEGQDLNLLKDYVAKGASPYDKSQKGHTLLEIATRHNAQPILAYFNTLDLRHSKDVWDAGAALEKNDFQKLATFIPTKVSVQERYRDSPLVKTLKEKAMLAIRNGRLDTLQKIVPYFIPVDEYLIQQAQNVKSTAPLGYLLENNGKSAAVAPQPKPTLKPTLPKSAPAGAQEEETKHLTAAAYIVKPHSAPQAFVGGVPTPANQPHLVAQAFEAVRREDLEKLKTLVPRLVSPDARNPQTNGTLENAVQRTGRGDLIDYLKNVKTAPAAIPAPAPAAVVPQQEDDKRAHIGWAIQHIEEGNLVALSKLIQENDVKPMDTSSKGFTLIDIAKHYNKKPTPTKTAIVQYLEKQQAHIEKGEPLEIFKEEAPLAPSAAAPKGETPSLAKNTYSLDDLQNAMSYILDGNLPMFKKIVPSKVPASAGVSGFGSFLDVARNSGQHDIVNYIEESLKKGAAALPENPPVQKAPLLPQKEPQKAPAVVTAPGGPLVPASVEEEEKIMGEQEHAEDEQEDKIDEVAQADALKAIDAFDAEKLNEFLTYNNINLDVAVDHALAYIHKPLSPKQKEAYNKVIEVLAHKAVLNGNPRALRKIDHNIPFSKTLTQSLIQSADFFSKSKLFRGDTIRKAMLKYLKKEGNLDKWSNDEDLLYNA